MQEQPNEFPASKAAASRGEFVASSTAVRSRRRGEDKENDDPMAASPTWDQVEELVRDSVAKASAGAKKVVADGMADMQALLLRMQAGIEQNATESVDSAVANLRDETQQMGRELGERIDASDVRVSRLADALEHQRAEIQSLATAASADRTSVAVAGLPATSGHIRVRGLQL